MIHVQLKRKWRIKAFIHLERNAILLYYIQLFRPYVMTYFSAEACLSLLMSYVFFIISNKIVNEDYDNQNSVGILILMTS